MAHLTVVRLPDGSLLALIQIARLSHFDGGTGILNSRDKMIAWLDTSELPEPDQEGAKQMISDIFEELINNPRRAKQPDWSFLKVTPLTSAIQPSRIKNDPPAPELKRAA